jgi:uncharacterized protein
MTDGQRTALNAYVAMVREHYGDRLVEIVAFGSRARGDNDNDSDLDLAIVLTDGDWDVWTETRWLAGKAFWPLVQGDLHIQPLPLRHSAWLDPQTHSNPRLLRNIKTDSRRLEDAA